MRPPLPASLAPAAALALALAFAPAVLAEDPPPPGPAPAPTTPGRPSPEEDQKRIEALVEKVLPKVEKARGLKFKRPVPAAPVTKAAFVERYMRDFTRLLGGEERVVQSSRLLARLGILAEGADLRTILGKYLEGNIAANYDPETGGISFLPGVQRTESLMFHELTHALDDQHFDMKAQIATWGTNFDRALAYGALAEGDAESVETRFQFGEGIAKQPIEGLRTMAEAFADNIMKMKFGATPPAVVLAFKSQYVEGAIFAEVLRRSEKGEEAVNEAFRKPPASTEQVLHPEKFLSGEAPAALALPEPPEGARASVAVTLGELCTRIVLQSKGVEAKAAAEATAGWGGDTVALVAFPAGEAVIWTTVWDSEIDAQQFLEALQKAFPARTGQEPERLTRGIVRRGLSVDFVEAPLDALPACVAMAKDAK